MIKEHIAYRRLLPDTLNGEHIQLTFDYYSFSKEEMDELENQLREEIGSGISADFGELRG